jgi:hypothetical protein
VLFATAVHVVRPPPLGPLGPPPAPSPHVVSAAPVTAINAAMAAVLIVLKKLFIQYSLFVVCFFHTAALPYWAALYLNINAFFRI